MEIFKLHLPIHDTALAKVAVINGKSLKFKIFNRRFFLFVKLFRKFVAIGFVLLVFIILMCVTQTATEAKVNSILSALVPLIDITQISTAGSHTCALTTQGGVKCWGANHYGQLGNGGQTYRSSVVDVAGLASGVQAVAAGGSHTCALTTQGGVKCWGVNGSGGLGDGTEINRYSPVDVVGLAIGVQAIAAGGYHTCALTTQGGVKCWGYNYFGQLGDGTETNRYSPVDVVGLAIGVQAIAAGGSHTCALMAHGGIKCWGYNYSGQLGDGIRLNRSSPVDVVGLASGVQAIAAGKLHTCALTTEGGVKCWGDNTARGLGDGTGFNRSSPVDVVGLASGVQAIAAGKSHTCALTTQGGVKCWGGNHSGQLGDGTQMIRSSPVDVVGLASGMQAIAVGDNHTCALTTQEGVKCWGYNYFGQLGDGGGLSQSFPGDVLVEDGGLTPVPTPTPSSMPPTEQVVVFIPGIAGSRLVDSIPASPANVIWPSFAFDSKEKLRLKPGLQENNIETDDAIRQFLVVSVYKSFLDSLSANGYVEYETGGDPNKRRQNGCDTSQTDATLFVFPWDWRFGAVDAVNSQGEVDSNLSLSPNNVELLEEYILCVLQIHPDAEITLISHSMGWFIGRTYVLENSTNHNIARHIAIAPPRLGAPEAIAMMLTGNWNWLLLGKDDTRTLLEHFPGAHQLLPSKWFWDHEGSPFSLNNPMTKRGDIEFSEFQQVLQDYYISPEEGDFYRSSVPFVSNMQKVYQNPAFADLRDDTSKVEYHIIYGVIVDKDGNDVKTTINKISEKPILGYDGVLELDKEYDYSWTTGDETVPEFSAAAKNDTIDLNRTTKTLHKLIGSGMEHQAMMNEPQLQDCVLVLLQGANCSTDVSASGMNQPVPARYIKLWGVGEVSITDGISTTQNLITTTLTLGMFPDISAKYLGDNSIIFIVTSDKQYTVNFTGQGEYFESENDYSSGDNNLRTIRFSPEPAAGQHLSLVTTRATVAEMNIDTDGDGHVDTAIQPVADLQDDVANDTTPPVVTASYEPATGLVVTAIDSESGLASIFYTVDGTHFQPYTEAVLFTDQSITNVTVIAQDKAGNFSNTVAVPVTVIASNTIYLPLINR